MSDADGDSQMRSSSDDGNESEALFPAANDPTTTLNQPPASLLFTSELSPPTSQDPPDQNGIHDDTMDLEPHPAPRVVGTKEQGHPSDVFGSTTIPQHSQVDGYGRSGEEQQEPGYAWSCKKARDEYQKAMEYVVDKNFSLGEFGDPFDDREEAGN